MLLSLKGERLTFIYTSSLLSTLLLYFHSSSFMRTVPVLFMRHFLLYTINMHRFSNIFGFSCRVRSCVPCSPYLICHIYVKAYFRQGMTICNRHIIQQDFVCFPYIIFLQLSFFSIMFERHAYTHMAAFTCLRVYAFTCLCLREVKCVCTCQKERERERQGNRQREKEI